MIEELYHSYQKELTAWCRGMTQNASLADDLVQEAFLRALINSQLLEHLRENQRRAWLYRTVKNLYLDRVRHSAYETAQEMFRNRRRSGMSMRRSTGHSFWNSFQGKKGCCLRCGIFRDITPENWDRCLNFRRERYGPSCFRQGNI